MSETHLSALFGAAAAAGAAVVVVSGEQKRITWRQKKKKGKKRKKVLHTYILGQEGIYLQRSVEAQLIKDTGSIPKRRQEEVGRFGQRHGDDALP